MRRQTIMLLVALLAFKNGKPQAPALYFEKISHQNGLSNNKVNCILQDRRGFVWIGTHDGLNRYDGNRFAIFRNNPADDATISGNIIKDLLEDEAGILWIATEDGGITKYDYRAPPRAQFKQYKYSPNDPASIPGNIINRLVQDSQGYLWLATSGKSVVRFDKKTGKFIEPVKEGTKNILDFCLDKKGVLWAGRQGGSLLKVDTKTLSYEMDKRYNDLYAKLPHASVSAVFNDQSNNTWFGSWDKLLFRHVAASGEEEVYGHEKSPYSFPNDEVHAFAEDSTGRIWMGGRYFGLTIYDPYKQQFFNYRHEVSKEGSIADNAINCIFISKTGITWLGTNKGISIYHPSQLPFQQTFLPRADAPVTIYDFHLDEQGSLWIGTSDGLFTRRANTTSFEHRKLEYKGKKLVVSKIFKDEDGTVFLGTNFTLFRYDLLHNRLQLLDNTTKDPVIYNIIESRIVSITRDTIEGHPVIITLPYGHFLAYYDLIDKRWISRTDTSKKIIESFNLKDNLLRKILKTRSGELWVATGKSGVAAWKKRPRVWMEYFQNDPTRDETISNNNVYDLAEDARGNLWVSTYGGGLNYFNTQTKKANHFNATNNLLEGLCVDGQGFVWMISNGQLNKFDPQLQTNTVFNLPDMEKTGGVTGNIYQDQQGDMYVSGPGYFIKFQPASVTTVSTQPKVYLTDFRIFNNSYNHLLYSKAINLQYHENYFTFEFSAPEFFSGQVEYAYKLDGFDEDWIESNQVNFANYSNLDGGDYVFKVRATNKKGTWAADYTSLNITIIPPFWERWWFFMLVGLLLVGMVYALYRYRINELIKRQAIRNKIAQDLHDSVGSTLSSVSVYSQVAKIYQAKGSQEELKNVIEKIATTATDMISEMNDIVWAIKPGNDSMEKILQRMDSFARPLMQTQEISFHLNYEPELLDVNLTMEQRKNFYLIFKETINNVLKYSHAGKCEVNIRVNHHSVEFTASDDGQGFDTEKLKQSATGSLSGNGLDNMKKRASEMKGTCEIESHPGMGTTIRVKFPVT